MNGTPPKVALIYNPVSGSGRSALTLRKFSEEIEKRWECHTVSTEKNRTPEQVREVCEAGYNRLIIIGGDGTVNESVNGIIRSGKSPILGIIPQGTGNDLARALGYYKRFKRNPEKYLEDIIEGMEETTSNSCNILSVNDKLYFANYLGIGFDAKIVRDFEKKRLLPLPNHLIYTYVTIKNLLHKCKGTLEIRGRKGEEWVVKDYKNILLINIPSYAGGLVKPKGVATGNGSFQLVIIKNLVDLIMYFINSWLPSFMRDQPNKRGAVIDEIKEIELYLPPGNIVQVDGEDYTDTLGKEKKLAVKRAGEIRVFK